MEEKIEDLYEVIDDKDAFPTVESIQEYVNEYGIMGLYGGIVEGSFESEGAFQEYFKELKKKDDPGVSPTKDEEKDTTLVSDTATTEAGLSDVSALAEDKDVVKTEEVTEQITEEKVPEITAATAQEYEGAMRKPLSDTELAEIEEELTEEFEESGFKDTIGKYYNALKEKADESKGDEFAKWVFSKFGDYKTYRQKAVAKAEKQLKEEGGGVIPPLEQIVERAKEIRRNDLIIKKKEYNQVEFLTDMWGSKSPLIIDKFNREMVPLAERMEEEKAAKKRTLEGLKKYNKERQKKLPTDIRVDEANLSMMSQNLNEMSVIFNKNDEALKAMPPSAEKNAAIDVRNENLKVLQSMANDVQRLANTINDNKQDLQSLEVEADLLKRNYDATTNSVGRLGASTASLGIGMTKAAKDVADMGLMLADFTIDKVAAGTGMDLEEYKDVIDYAQKKSTTAEEYLDAANEYINTNIRGNLRKARTLDDLESFTDWAQWTGDLFADQIPQLAMIMATGGNTGLFLLSGSAYGNKLNDMEKEMSISQDVYNDKVKELNALPKGSKEHEEKEKELESLKKSLENYDFWQLRGTSAMVAAGEFASEKVTQGILKRAMGSPRMYGALGKIDKGKLSADFKRAAAKNYKDKIAKVGAWAADPFMEGGSEVLAQINENIADKFIMGKDVGLWDHVPDAFVSGLFIGGGIKIAGGTMGLVMKDVTADKNKTISKNLQEIKKLTDMVATLQQQEQTDVTKLQIDIANTAIAQREIENGQMILGGLDVLNRLSAKEIREVSKLNDDVSKIRDEYRKISEATNITEEQKAGLIEALEKQYNDVVTRKDGLMKIGQSKDSRYIINNKEVTAEEMQTFLESEENITKIAEGETNIKIFNDTTLEKDFAKKIKAKAPITEEVVEKDPLWKRLFSGKKAKTKLDKETDAALKEVEKEMAAIESAESVLMDKIKKLKEKSPEKKEEIQKLEEELFALGDTWRDAYDKKQFLDLGIKNPTQEQIDLLKERNEKVFEKIDDSKAYKKIEKDYNDKILALEKPFDPTKEEAPVAEEVVEEKAVEKAPAEAVVEEVKEEVVTPEVKEEAVEEVVEDVAEDAGDVAAEYRKAKEDFLKDNPDTPQSVIDVMDNMIRSAEELDAKTKEAPIEEQAEPYEQWLEGYKERTGQFLKENPDLGQGAKDAINNMMEQAESVVEKSKDEEVKEKTASAKPAKKVTKKKPVAKKKAKRAPSSEVLTKAEKENRRATEQEIEEWRDKRGDETTEKRAPGKAAHEVKVEKLKDNARKLYNKEITVDEYLANLKEIDPQKQATKVPEPATAQEVDAAIDIGQRTHGIIGIDKSIKQGTEVVSRVDIPAKRDMDIGVVPLKDKPSAKTFLGYSPTAVLKNARWDLSPTNVKNALQIAMKEYIGGKRKGKKASKTVMGWLKGTWQQMTPEQAYEYAQKVIGTEGVDAKGKKFKWTQISMNPARHSYTHEVGTEKPVIAAEEVIQIGNFLLAKNVTFASPKDVRYAAPSKTGKKDIYFRAKEAPTFEEQADAMREHKKEVPKKILEEKRPPQRGFLRGARRLFGKAKTKVRVAPDQTYTFVEADLTPALKRLTPTQKGFQEGKNVVVFTGQQLIRAGLAQKASPKQLREITVGAYDQQLRVAPKTIKGVPQKQVQALIDRLQKAFPNTTFFTNKKAWDKMMADPQVEAQMKKYVKEGEVIYGMTVDGKVYLNPDIMDLNTPIHEIGHIWLNLMRDSKEHKALYDKGLKLVEGTKEFQEAKERLGDTVEAREEALAVLIGNKGETITTTEKKNNFKQWLKDLWESIKDVFPSLRKLTPAQIENLTIDSFVEGVVRDVLAGEVIDKKAGTITEILNEPLDTQDINTLRASLRKKMPNAYINDILTQLAKAMKDPNHEVMLEGFQETQLIEDAIDNGITLNEIGNLIRLEGLEGLETNREIINYFNSIGKGEKASQGLFKRLAGMKTVGTKSKGFPQFRAAKKPKTRAGILKEIQKRLKPTADIYLKKIKDSKAKKTKITREIKLAINDIKNKYRGKWKTMNEAELQEVLDKLKDLETKGKEQRKAIEKSQEAKRKEMIAESAVLIEKSGKNIATPIPLETDTEIAAFKKNVLSKDEGRYSNPEAAFIVDGKAMMHAEMKALIKSGKLEYKNIQVLEATTKNHINESNKRIRIEDWIYPPSAKDLETLLYALYGKGKEGKAFFEKHILNTLDKAVVDEIIMSQEFLNEYKKLEKKYLRPRNIKELVSNQMNKKTGIKSVGKTPMDITVGEAIYLYNFIKDPRMYTKLNQGNIDMAVMDKVVDYMNKNPRYKNYADGLVDLYAKFRDDIEISLDAEGYDTFGRPTYSSYDAMVDFYYEQNKGKMSDTEAMDLAKKEADKTQDLLVKIYGGADKIPQNIPYTPSRVDSNTDEMSVDDILDPNGFNKAMTVITGNLVAKTEGGAVEWRGVIPADIAYQYSKGVIHAATFLKFFSQSNAVLVSNLKRIEDLKGKKFADELKLSLGRIITNSRTYQQKMNWFSAAFNDYINGSQGVIMFLNTKSAALQFLSTANFMVEIGPEKYFSAMKHINKKDAADFITSPYVKQRIGGAAGDVMIDEIINTRGGGVRKLYAMLMKAGYSLTKAADVSAIVIGGLPYYQAKKQQYLSEMKNGKAVYTEAQAKEKAMVDFVRASEKGQQSKMLRMLSSQQIIPSTKMVLAFANIPLQYNRLMYQAASDIKNRRGNMMGNVLKIGYYLTAQNLLFAALQQGLFAAFLSGDDEELDKKTQTTLNTFANTLLRGLGVTGAFAAMLKDIALYTLDSEDISEIEKQERQEEIVMGIAPPIGYKLSQWRRAARDLQYAKTEEEMTKAEIKRWSVIANLPANRMLLKYEALSDANNSQYELWERLFRAGGWSRWSLGMDPTWKEKQKLEKINKELKTIPTPVPIPVPVPVPVPTPVSVP